MRLGTGEHLVKHARAPWAYSAHSGELLRPHACDGCDGPEFLQQSACRSRAQSANTGQHRHRIRRCVRSRLFRARPTVLLLSDSDQPQSRLLEIKRSQDSDTLVHRSQQRAADGCIRERACVERSSFNQQVRLQPSRSKVRELRPQPTLAQRRVEVVLGLALHNARANSVVADTQRRDLDSDVPRLERVDHSAPALVHVGSNRQAGVRTHSVGACPSTCAPFFSEREKE